jgi:hypothetical protein
MKKVDAKKAARSARACKEQSMRNDTKGKSEEYEKNLKELWLILRSSTPKDREEITKQLDEKTINSLRTMANPYKKPVFLGDSCKMLAFGIINMTEKYSERFAMTSLVGFLYRMLDEYKPPDTDEYPSENDAEFAIPFNTKIRELQRARPEERLLTEVASLKEQIEALRMLPEPSASELAKITELARQSYFTRAQLLKHRIYWVREDFTIISESRERANKELNDCESKQALLKTNIETLKTKYEKRKTYREQLGKAAPSEATLPEALSIEDVNKKGADYLIEIENKEKLVVKGESLVIELTEKADIRQAQYEETEAKLSALNDQFRDLKVEYLKKTGRTKMAADVIREAAEKKKTAESSKISKAKRSKTNSRSAKTELDELQVEKYEPTEEDYDSIAAEVKAELGIEKTAEEYTIEAQNGIEKFLDEYLRYNPDNHVRSAYKPNYEDTQRTPLEKTKNEDLANKTYERTCIPPDDTFFRWKRYAENNYECLRQATDDIYCEKSDFEAAIVPLAVFEGKDKDSVNEEYNKFKRKYADEFDAEVFGATFGSWNFLSSWEQNREVRDFYTERTEIIKRIIDQHKNDQRMGTSLMKDRVAKKKKENEEKDGAHDPGLTTYRKSMRANASLERHGGRHVDEIEVSDIPRDTDESSQDEVEVGVHVIRPYLGGGRRRIPRGIGEQWKFHIPTEPLPEGSVNIQSSAEFQEKNKDLLD